ncbi:hypothetical protein ACFQZ2_13805, partial [Streptomonospora algeriensis]
AHPAPGPGYRSGDRDAAARALVAAEPGITGTELARRLGLTTRTGQRIRNRIGNEKRSESTFTRDETGSGGEVLRQSDG